MRAWNKEYHPGQQVSLSVEVDQDDLATLVATYRLVQSDVSPTLAYRIMKAIAVERLFEGLQERYGEPPTEPAGQPAELKSRLVALRRQHIALAAGSPGAPGHTRS